jgi:acetyltransferase-like isoleucine patch superfamily enzyme
MIIWILVPLLIVLYALFASIVTVLFMHLRKFYKKVPDGVYKKGSAENKFNELRNSYYYTLISKFLGPFDGLASFNKIHNLFGAKLGKSTYIGGCLVDNERIEMGDNCFLGALAAIITHTYEGDNYVLKKVKIGNNVTIGVGATIFPGVEIGDNTIIGANTVIPANKKIPPNSVWIGAKPQRLK